MIAYLVCTRGKEVDRRYRLDPEEQTLLGRGPDCQVSLADPLASRVHAIISWDGQRWEIADAGSRNGTLVNGTKIDTATLNLGARIRIGNVELEFLEEASGQQPATPDALTQTLVQATPVSDKPEPLCAVEALRDPRRAQHLLDLHQLALRLLGGHDATQVIDLVLSIIQSTAEATVVGLLWVDDTGRMRPRHILPPDRPARFHLSSQLTSLVGRQGRAIWIKNESRPPSDGQLSHYADAICVPLINHQRLLGALHLYRENHAFNELEFDFAIAASRMLARALFAAQEQMVLVASRDRLIARNADFDELLGASAPMLELKERIVRVAAAQGCVLIRGESGTGKELVARAIHRASPRAERPLLSVNCAAIPSELMESQLFGHKKGAFTGADRDHTGWFQQADTGTLFLDEVGELTLEGQAKLLRILEGHPFLPVGSTAEVQVDVRVVAATNRDLQEFVREKRFREDLFYRLTVFELWLPPLRRRGSDIPLLIDHFFDHFRQQHGRSKLEISPAARKRLVEYSWPGNVRQLRNVIDSAVVLASGQEIQPSDLGLRDVDLPNGDSLKLADWEQRLIVQALTQSGQKIPAAAEMLGISRATLYRKLDAYGIPRS